MGGELELERAGQEDWAEGLRSGREDGWRAGRRVRGLEGRAGPQRGSEDGGVPLDSPVVPLYPAYNLMCPGGGAQGYDAHR